MTRMRRIGGFLLPLSLAASATQAQISRFDHVVVIIQENRTPDNLFQGLCSPPYGSASACSPTPHANQYDIKTSRWRDKNSLRRPDQADHDRTGEQVRPRSLAHRLARHVRHDFDR